MKKPISRSLFITSCGLLLGAVPMACNSITGLDDFSVKEGSTGGKGSGGTSSSGGTRSSGGQDSMAGDTGEGGAPSGGECVTNQECIDKATQAAGTAEEVPAICVKSDHHCATLLSEDCKTITGDYKNNDAIVLGSLFSTVGAQAATNLQRQQSAMLAIQEINSVGGVPAATSGGGARKLVLVSCDESTMLSRAAGHLVNDLDVPAIIGPNTSQDTIDVSTQTTVSGNTVVMSPTAVASSIASLIDDDLTWLMVPNDEQRAPLMLDQINELETRIKTERSVTTVKLGVVYRDDALGKGTQISLNKLIINGKGISDSINLGKNVYIDGYDYKKADQNEIVQKYVTFAPDIVVLAGTAEAITAVMKPLEAAWPPSNPNRPQYVLIDSVKVPDLITLVTGNDELRHRVRGTGIKPGPDSAPVYDAFQIAYKLAFPGSSSSTSGMGPAYDATYAIAFALAATRAEAVTGTSIAKGLRRLAGGTTQIEVGGTKATQAFQKLAAGEKIKAIGTFGPLDWDTDGAVVGGTLEMWCIGSPTGTPTYQTSGLTFDIMTQKKAGQYTQCAP
ncbi:MAG TPA: ABC transporter substrate-binding protein [Polyangiaceae bacterium]|nr:ABC transporter substrate-binding protein [Polyangiaceae bacterium]